jgi:hypothetical protein
MGKWVLWQTFWLNFGSFSFVAQKDILKTVDVIVYSIYGFYHCGESFVFIQQCPQTLSK